MLSLNSGLRFGTLMRLRWDYLVEDELVIPGEETKGNKDFCVPLLPKTLKAIALMRGYDRQFILPRGDNHKSTIHKENRALNKLAGLKGKDYVSSQRVRRLVLTQLGMVNAVAAQQAGSHSNFNTTIKHYLNSQILAIRFNNLIYVPM